ncbi:MAG: ABC transporter ATP-binding protein [Rhizobiaceae bacterium]|nr:MAG: ABC transporter ATP-binding protein [Rhizobiaceae bacterium]
MLEISGLFARYGGITALRDVSMTIPDGAVVALLGSNGAGKSTLLNSIMGSIEGVTEGSIRLNGEEVRGKKPTDLMHRGVAMAPEGRQIFSDLSIDENLRMGAYLRRDPDGIRSDRDRIFALFPRLEERHNQRAGTLSGGEQQMLAIGRALMSRPQLLLLDEPSLGLAPLFVTQIMRIVSDINAGGIAVVLVEQNARQALRVSTEGYVMERGTIRMSGRACDLSKDPSVTAAYLGGN